MCTQTKPGVLFGTGDIIAQFLIEGKVSKNNDKDSTTSDASWDVARTGRMAIFGAGFAGPVLHHWYKFLDRKIQLSTPFRSLLGRVAVDQLCFAPCFIASFFVGQGLLAGASKQTIQGRLKKVMADLYKALVKNETCSFNRVHGICGIRVL